MKRMAKLSHSHENTVKVFNYDSMGFHGALCRYLEGEGNSCMNPMICVLMAVAWHCASTIL
jgi:hypothetical protein